MRRLITLLVISSALSFSAIPSTVQWDIRTTGADTNGCGYDPKAGANFDRSGWTASVNAFFDAAHNAAKAVDGDTTTYWSSGNAGFPDYLIVDMGAIKTFDT